MTASSFGHLPGLPILHSKDLINWRIMNHVLPRIDLPVMTSRSTGTASGLRPFDSMTASIGCSMEIRMSVS